MSKLIACQTGTAGAGKSTIEDGLKEKGFKINNIGNAVKAEAKKRNVDPTTHYLGKLMLELREKNGPGAVAELIKPSIENSNANVIVIDGIRSNDEIQVLKKSANVKLLSILASTDTRFTFLHDRGRSDDPKSREIFEERDNRELGIGVGKSIELADESISNNELTKDELIEAAYQVIQSWKE